MWGCVVKKPVGKRWKPLSCKDCECDGLCMKVVKVGILCGQMGVEDYEEEEDSIQWQLMEMVISLIEEFKPVVFEDKRGRPKGDITKKLSLVLDVHMRIKYRDDVRGVGTACQVLMSDGDKYSSYKDWESLKATHGAFKKEVLSYFGVTKDVLPNVLDKLDEQISGDILQGRY